MPRIKEQFEAMRNTTKQKIITAGLKLFSYRGLAATSIQDIATQSGISTGLLYHYYRSKEDLFQELVILAVNSSYESAKIFFTADQTPAEKIKTFTQEVLKEIGQGEEIGQFYLLMSHYILENQAPVHHQEIIEKSTAALAWLKETLLEGQTRGEVRSGDVDQLSLLYFAAVQGLAIYKLILPNRFTLPEPDMLSNLLLI